MGLDHICRGRALRIAVEFTALAILLLAGGAGAATLTVCSSGCTYNSIQVAINAASTGDIVEVQSGTYYENVNVNKSLILKGIDTGGGKPVVNARGNGDAITLSAGNSVLEGFTIVNSGEWPNAGILVNSNNNLLRNNNASNNGNGISLWYSSNNTLISNNASSNNNYNGIYLGYSSNNNMLSNNTASNNSHGIFIGSSSNNMLNGNNILSNNNYGIYLFYSSNNMLNDNNILSNNYDGILIMASSNNTLTNNKMVGNNYNFLLSGIYDSDFNNQIDKSNLVDGKPIYYINGASDIIYDPSTNAGTFYCINCINVTIKNL